MKTFHVVGFCGQENPSQTVRGSYYVGGGMFGGYDVVGGALKFL